MSDLPGGHEPAPEDDEAEVVAGVPVLVESARLQSTRPAPVPARQAAVVAASSFLAGAAAVAMVRRGRVPRLRRRSRRSRRTRAVGEVVTTHSFLVDVHVLRRG